MKKSLAVSIFIFLRNAAICFFALTVLLVMLFRWLPVPFTPLMLIRCSEQIKSGNSLKLSKNWEPLNKISGKLQLAVVCTEDQNFLAHNGFDFGAIKKAMNENKWKKRKRGASTISQQTAKNLFLWPGRSWVRKGLEVYFTFLIETFWSKQRIMEVYLNIIEMGKGIYGAEAASMYYFDKSAASLSSSEAALIAVILPNPRKFSASSPSNYILKRKRFALRQMNFWGGKLDYDNPPPLKNFE
ncbi:MAG: monofunctional biosynthetic peptidoglycan transglycosylase [Bacteroidetes bacterium]|nr:monofunctional biosynthetic peptidoglycan transglycosylase [Bacteroidota bacterium]